MYTTGIGGPWIGDFDGDQDVDFDDFVIQALNFGDYPDAEEQLGSLPEPGALALMLIGGMAAGGRRRRR
jgi:hypothetical protein